MALPTPIWPLTSPSATARLSHARGGYRREFVCSTLLSTAWLCAAFPVPTAAQISGRVLEEGRNAPVAGAFVSLMDQRGHRKAEAFADSAGQYTLAAPADGAYVIVATRLGYAEFRSPLLSLASSRRAEVDLMMVPVPLGLEGLEVSVESYSVRRLRAFGQTPETLGRRWIDRERIESVTSALRTEDVIRWQTIPGVWVEVSKSSPSTSPLCVRSLRGRVPCALTVLNGMIVDPVEANQLDPLAIESIAVLSPMDAATLYGTRGGGGAVLIWLR